MTNTFETLNDLKEEIQKAKENKQQADKKLADLEQELQNAVNDLQATIKSVRPATTLTEIKIPDWFMRGVWVVVIVIAAFIFFSWFGKPEAKSCPLFKPVQERRVERRETKATPVIEQTKTEPLVQEVISPTIPEIVDFLPSPAPDAEPTAVSSCTVGAGCANGVCPSPNRARTSGFSRLIRFRK
jgi:hypothetical protein